MLINDTTKILEAYSNNLEEILVLDENNVKKEFEDNLFVILSTKYRKLTNNNIIKKFKSSNTNSNIIQNDKEYNSILINKSSFKSKKTHEVDNLSEFIIETLNSQHIKNIIELGCGKCYLNEKILISEDVTYIGIDKQAELVDKTSHSSKFLSKNSVILYKNINVHNFDKFYNETLFSYISGSNSKTTLIGLHACGNLTSDTIKIFRENKLFTSLTIVGCCANLLKEFVSDKARNSELFQFYINNIGFDKSDKFLEETLIYDDIELVGYPLSSFLKENYAEFFMGRVIRNTAMQGLPKKEDKLIKTDNLSYKKMFFRTMLQAFLERNIPNLKLYYGFGKIKLKNDFYDFCKQALQHLEKSNITKYQKYSKFDLDEKSVNGFYDEYKKYEAYLWALYIVRFKFARIFELIITVDRAIYICEKNDVSYCEIYEIFDQEISSRNLLINAYK